MYRLGKLPRRLGGVVVDRHPLGVVEKLLDLLGKGAGKGKGTGKGAGKGLG